MLHVVDTEISEFRQMASRKNVIAFGAGAYMRCFLLMYPDISYMYVADNYGYMDTEMAEVDDIGIPVMPPDELLQIDPQNSIIIITSLRLEEIICQLDQIDVLDGVPCFFAAALAEYAGVNQELRVNLMSRMQHLAARTYESYLYDNYALANRTSQTKRYQIWEHVGNTYIAGSKAKVDVKLIAGQLGYEIVNAHSCIGEIGTKVRRCSDRLVKEDWVRCIKRIPDHSILILQSLPDGEWFLEEDFLRLKQGKNIRIIYIVHDVETLRELFLGDYHTNELALIRRMCDICIVHNQRMKEYLVKQGIDAGRMISLNIFDYLSDADIYYGKHYEKSITIAGNLSLTKSRYLMQLRELKNVKIHLYGPNFTEEMRKGCDFIDYHGVLPAEELPCVLCGGFGLVWDGESIDTCSGLTGQYLRYNNPHKLSLYLTAGLPVIIWSGAAAADYVRENHAGIVVDSIRDLETVFESMNEEDYIHYAQNARRVSQQLLCGEYTRRAIEQAEALLGEENNICGQKDWFGNYPRD